MSVEERIAKRVQYWMPRLEREIDIERSYHNVCGEIKCSAWCGPSVSRREGNLFVKRMQSALNDTTEYRNIRLSGSSSTLRGGYVPLIELADPSFYLQFFIN